jgi:hypothetical protein
MSAVMETFKANSMRRRSVRTDGARVWPRACCSDDLSFFLFAPTSTSTSRTRSVPGSSWRLFYPLAALPALKYIDYSYWSAQASKRGGRLENDVKSPLSLFVNTYTTIQPTVSNSSVLKPTSQGRCQQVWHFKTKADWISIQDFAPQTADLTSSRVQAHILQHIRYQ